MSVTVKLTFTVDIGKVPCSCILADDSVVGCVSWSADSSGETCKLITATKLSAADYTQIHTTTGLLSIRHTTINDYNDNAIGNYNKNNNTIIN